jgi:hypothetical protein
MTKNEEDLVIPLHLTVSARNNHLRKIVKNWVKRPTGSVLTLRLIGHYRPTPLVDTALSS